MIWLAGVARLLFDFLIPHFKLSHYREVLIIDTLGRERHNLISSNAVAKAVNWNRSAPAGVMTGVKGAVRHLIRQCH